MGSEDEMQKRLNETAKKQLLETALLKALSSAPLTLVELEALQEVDVGALIVEHNMSFSEAKQIVMWRRNERNRINASSLDVPIEGYTPVGVRQGSRFAEIQESSVRRVIKDLILEELNRSTIKDDKR